MPELDDNTKQPSFWNPDRWAINLSIMLISIGATYKVAITPFTLQLDLNALLSLLLALFSVTLSALFYFKANEASNAFYDNTYKFTKDIAELLVRIESGFGERLRHLDEGYTSMRDHITTAYPSANVGEAKKELKAEEDEVKEKEHERDKLLDELLKKTQLDSVEKEKIRAQLIENEKGLMVSRHEAAVLKQQLGELMSSKNEFNVDLNLRRPLPQTAKSYLRTEVAQRMGGAEAVAQMSNQEFRANFSVLFDEFPPQFIDDLRVAGIEFIGDRISLGAALRLRKQIQP